MWTLVLLQHQKSLTALLEDDKDLAREIFLVEERVNSCEQFIESDCEHYFSLRGSETGQIPFAMFALKTARQLGIIGDLASNIALDILSARENQEALLAYSGIDETFGRSNKIIELVKQAFDDDDVALAEVALKRIADCEEKVLDCKGSLGKYLRIHPNEHNEILSLFSILESLKRTLEVIRNISVAFIKYKQGASIEV